MEVGHFKEVTNLCRLSVADPGFPVAGAPSRWGGGRRHPMQALFGENVCENKRIGPHLGGAGGALPGFANDCITCEKHHH